MQGDFKLYDLGNLILASGETLRGASLAYRTCGVLNAEKSNAILVTTWFSGTGKVMQDVYVGPNHALDPQRYFIVIVDQLGSGVSSSPQNTPAPQAMAKFPKLTTADDVLAQHRLLTDLFGIEKLALVVGGSMGGSRFMNGRSPGPGWSNGRHPSPARPAFRCISGFLSIR